MRRAGAMVASWCALGLVLACAVASPASALTGIGYPDFSDVSGLQLNGSATQHDTALQLTAAAQNQRSSAYSTTKIDPSQSFSSSFVLSISNGSAEPADGMAFVLQSAGPTAISPSGLGASLGYAGIAPSVAVEFDIFNGDPGDPGYVPSGAVDAGDQHVAITRNGDSTDHLSCATLNVPPVPPCTARLPSQLYGALVHAWVDYTSPSHQLSVYLSPSTAKPARPTLSTTIDLGSALGPSTFAGFTAATGRTYAQQEVLEWRLISGFALAPGPAADSDRDGIRDSADRCPARKGGRYDRDHDGCPGPYRRMKPRIRAHYLLFTDTARLRPFKVVGVPGGAKVSASCERCRGLREVHRQPARARRHVVELTAIEGARLPLGAKVVIRVTAPGYIGYYLRITVRRQRRSKTIHPFPRVRRCLPPGSDRPAKKCRANPR